MGILACAKPPIGVEKETHVDVVFIQRSLGQHRPPGTVSSPIELAKGTGDRVLAMLGEQWTGANQIWWGEGSHLSL